MPNTRYLVLCFRLKNAKYEIFRLSYQSSKWQVRDNLIFFHEPTTRYFGWTLRVFKVFITSHHTTIAISESKFSNYEISLAARVHPCCQS